MHSNKPGTYKRTNENEYMFIDWERTASQYTITHHISADDNDGLSYTNNKGGPRTPTKKIEKPNKCDNGVINMWNIMHSIRVCFFFSLPRWTASTLDVAGCFFFFFQMKFIFYLCLVHYLVISEPKPHHFHAIIAAQCAVLLMWCARNKREPTPSE